MIRLDRHGDVLRLRMSSWRGRLIHYDASAYFTRGVLIDSGFPLARGDLGRLLAEVRPDGAMITHWHEDHAGNVPLLAERGIPLAISGLTLEALRTAPRLPAYRWFTWGALRPLTDPVTPFTPDGLQMIPTPGHSVDHHVVWDAERATLFSGDLWLGVHVKLSHRAEDPRLLARSLRKALTLRPRRMFDAHRGPVSEPVGALATKAVWLENAIAAIDEKIAAGWSDRAIAREVLGREDWAGFVSRGEYARINMVRALRRTPKPG
jgi:ribonuclease/clavin/mitogillin